MFNYCMYIYIHMYIHIFIHVYAYTWTYKNASCTHYVMSPAEAWLEERGLEDEVVRPSCSVTSPRSICFSENYYVLYVLYINIYICVLLLYIYTWFHIIYIWLYTHVLYRVYVCTDIMSISFIVDLHSTDFHTDAYGDMDTKVPEVQKCCRICRLKSSAVWEVLRGRTYSQDAWNWPVQQSFLQFASPTSSGPWWRSLGLRFGSTSLYRKIHVCTVARIRVL